MSGCGGTGVDSGWETKSNDCPISKAFLGSLAHLKFASVLVVWDARGKFKDLRKRLEAFPGYFSCDCEHSLFFLDGKRQGGQVGRLVFTLRGVLNKQTRNSSPSIPRPALQRNGEHSQVEAAD